MTYTGAWYTTGTGVTKNEAEAVRFYSLAAEQGHAKAQYSLGECYVFRCERLTIYSLICFMDVARYALR
jgi:hypothetical protein